MGLVAKDWCGRSPSAPCFHRLQTTHPWGHIHIKSISQMTPEVARGQETSFMEPFIYLRHFLLLGLTGWPTTTPREICSNNIHSHVLSTYCVPHPVPCTIYLYTIALTPYCNRCCCEWRFPDRETEAHGCEVTQWASSGAPFLPCRNRPVHPIPTSGF